MSLKGNNIEIQEALLYYNQPRNQQLSNLLAARTDGCAVAGMRPRLAKPVSKGAECICISRQESRWMKITCKQDIWGDGGNCVRPGASRGGGE